MNPTITRVTEITDIGDKGQMIPSVRIEFKVGEHGPFSVTLAKNTFTATAANQKIAEFVSHLRALQGVS